jgi:plasmid stabilization system protein ParE
MVNKGIKVVLDNVALSQLKQACNYIKKDSPQNSRKVKNDIFSACMALSLHPEKFPPDKYRRENDGSYRSFEKHRLRVAYFISEQEITIVSIRHTSMEPLEY